jgi:hypothetical protein
MGYVTDILIGAAGSLVAAEIYVHAERIARWLTKKAVARLPPEDRERRLEEWTADLEDMPGAVTKLSWAVGCHWAATAANLRKRPPRRALDARTVISRGKVSLRGVGVVMRIHSRGLTTTIISSAIVAGLAFVLAGGGYWLFAHFAAPHPSPPSAITDLRVSLSE